ncbi:MAG TPA: bacillithiol biosynthesis deacetylase BshB1 [Ignavibacteria bacterium]
MSNKNVLDLKLDALFIATHPDDIEITCGGTCIKLVAAKKKVGIVDLTEGELSSRGTLVTRRKETRFASKILGIHYRKNLGLQDGNIQNNLPNRIEIIREIRTVKPKILFAPYPSDRHPDHINAGNLIRESVFLSGLSKIEIDDLEPHRPAKVFYYRHAYDFPISFIFDISDVFEKKIKAIMAYNSQFYKGNKNKISEPETYISTKLFLDNLTHRSAFFGFKIGVKYGEPFFCYENLNIDSQNIFKI